MYARTFHPYARLPGRQGPRGQGVVYGIAASRTTAPRPGAPMLPKAPRGAAFSGLPAKATMFRARPAVLPGRSATPGITWPTPGGMAAVPSLPKPTVATIGPVTLLPGAENANAKAKFNEWLTKVGHVAPYETVPCASGFQATLKLPLEDAGDAAIVSGVGPSKKVAEQACAEQALQVLASFGLLDILAQPSKRTLKVKAPKAKTQSNGTLAIAAAPVAPQLDFVSHVAGKDFEIFKQTVYQLVMNNPAKRTSDYVRMCRGAAQQNRLLAALIKLVEDGVVVKHASTPEDLWTPLGYDGLVE